MRFIDLQTQYETYKAEIDRGMQGVLDHGQYIMGPEVHELEKQLVDYAGVKHCLTVASGTDALLMPLMALDIGPGDEVITTPFTFIASAEVIALLGAKPVFVDIEPDTFNMDVEQLEAAITPRTKAIMPISLYGQMADYTRINAIAAKYGIPVIEDAAQSFGATRNGGKSGSVTTMAATSFFPSKPLGCYGDGGAIFLNDDDLASRLRAIRNHGGEKRYHHEYVGLNGRFDTLQAAVVLVKLKQFNTEIKKRQKVAERYNEGLRTVCTTPCTAEGNTHVWAQYTIRVADRDALAQALNEKDIPTAVHYPTCLHRQPVFEHLGYGKGAFPVAEQMAEEVISLPMHPWLSVEDQNVIITNIKESLAVSV